MILGGKALIDAVRRARKEIEEGGNRWPRPSREELLRRPRPPVPPERVESSGDDRAD